MTATLRLSDAEVGYRDTTVLTGLDLTVRPGELLAVLGPSGCGKSTLLRALAGLLPVRAGTVLVNDTPLTGHKAGLPLVFQDDGLLPWRSALRNVTLPLAISGVPRAERRARALSWLDRVGLAGYEHHLPRQLSGGMRQRVQLARALAGEPRVVLMDEPFGALDPRSRRAMQELLRDVREAAPVTVVFVTHDVSEALLLADRIIVLGGRPARIVAETDTLSVDAARDRVLAALTDPVEVPA